MTAPRFLTKLLFGALLAATAAATFAACDDGTGQNDGGYATETEACLECQAILVECTSTSRDEVQFVECRDQWQTCQNGRGLNRELCGNPGDNEACSLCRARMTECKAEDGANATKCEEEFGICKAYLITRGDIQQQCTATAEVPPEVACGVCQKDMAVCVSDTSLDNAAAVCASKFEQCAGANGLAAGQCAVPAAERGCTLCTEHHAECQASAGPQCAAGFDACATAIASTVTCTLDTTGPGGAGGEGGGGGAGGGTTGCSHDVCVEGDALPIGCDGGSCVADVCATDNWCCDNEWDEFCVQTAQATASCSCG